MATRPPTPPVRSFWAKMLDYVLAGLGLMTLASVVFSFIQAAGAMPQEHVTLTNWFIGITIALNGIASLVTVIYYRTKAATMTGVQAANYFILATTSFFMDVVSMMVGVLSAVTPGMYIYLGIALLIDLIADVITHAKRN
jgi:hypothetical protein